MQTLKEKIQSLLAHAMAVVAKPVSRASRFVNETFAKLKELMLDA